MENRKAVRLVLFSVLIWICIFLFSLKWGAVLDAEWEVIQQIRLPRVFLATAIGVGLSVGGAVLQALFSNPLCEPYTLGISAGAAVGAVVGSTLGLEWSVAGLVGSAFLGAGVFTGILYWVSLREKTENLTLLLTGMMLSFLGSSLVAVWAAFTPSMGIQGALLWLFGDLSRARLSGALFCWVAVGFLFFLIWRCWRDLDGMLLGEEGALASGVDVVVSRRRMVFLTSLLIGLCVSAGGMIGFIGLVIPHFCRRMTGSLHFFLLPLCAIWGAIALTLADCFSRTAIRPYELPIGVVTALVGAPVFLWILLRREAARL